MNELGFLLTSADHAEKVQFNLRLYNVLSAADKRNYMYAKRTMDETVCILLISAI